MRKMEILVVDDEPGHVLMLKALLGKWGYAVAAAGDGEEAVSKVREHPFDLVLMDVRMEGLDGISALKAIKAHNPAVPVLIMTAYSTVASAVEALKSGAHDYLLKPLDFDQLRSSLEKSLRRAMPPVTAKDPLPQEEDVFMGIVGRSPGMLEMRELVRTVAPTQSTVLITGKSGTGKELVAMALHALSPRKDNALVVVNCAALSRELLESELFGHERGSFTGADKKREGRFFQAHGGSIFLDEIGEVPLDLQAKLLRAIQQKEIQRVGSDATLTVDVRIIAATNRDLREEVAAGNFREDLFYRLNVMEIRVPSLNERGQDIPLLSRHFLQEFAQKNNKYIKGFTPRAMDMLLKYPWPGNVRELQNTLEQAVVLQNGPYISEGDLPAPVRIAAPQAEKNEPPFPLEGKLEDLEREAIVRTLRLTGDNKSDAAERLGISRKTLYAKLKRYEIE